MKARKNLFIPSKKYLDLLNKKLKSLLFFALKLFVSSGILYFLISKIGIHTIIKYIKAIDLLVFASAVCLYIFSIYISSLRWSLLITQKIGIKRLFSMYMIGSFFNTCLPGIIGGDAVKAYYLNRELKNAVEAVESEDDEQNPFKEVGITAIASVFMDRYIGFWALMFIGIIAFPFGLGYLEKTPEKVSLIWLMPLIFFAFILASLSVFWFRIGERFRFVLKIYEYFGFYKTKKIVIFRASIYSVIIQLINIASVYILSKGLSFEIPLLPLLIFLPLITVISLIPVSISGLGLREFAFVIFLGSTGVPSNISVALSLCWFFSIVVASIPGFFLYLLYKDK